MIAIGIPESQARIAYQQASMALQQKQQALDEDFRQKQLAQQGSQFQQDFGLRQQQFGENQRQFNTSTGMGLANLAASLSGPENWGRFSDAMRGNPISGDVPFFLQQLQGNNLTYTGTVAPTADNLPGPLTVESLIGNANAAGGAPADGRLPQMGGPAPVIAPGPWNPQDAAGATLCPGGVISPIQGRLPQVGEPSTGGMILNSQGAVRPGGNV